MKKLALHWQILIAIGLAGLAGFLVNYFGNGDPMSPQLFGVSYLTAFQYIGEMFLNALKMIIVPLITSSIIVGMAGIGNSGNLGRLGGRTLLFYAVTTLAAILVGLSLINAVGPGYADGQPVGETLALDASGTDIAARVEGKGAGDVADIFLRMVPPNVVMAAAEGQMLGIIFFALLFGYFMTRIGHDLAEPMFKFWDGVFNVMMRMTEWIMKFAPIGVFGLVAAVVSESGFEALGKFNGHLGVLRPNGRYSRCHIM
jgi:Na+/H+-dicarboxylate symporter